MKLYIKNMVCDRCKMVVNQILTQLNIEVEQIELGEVIIQQDLDEHTQTTLAQKLNDIGFELLDDKRKKIVEKIKNVVIEMIYQGDDSVDKITPSFLIAERVGRDYKYLSTLFSEIEGKTIEQYLIFQKIERVKELLVYDELTLSQIADQLHYSSVQHLSNQFKKVMGQTPSRFKEAQYHTRKALDEI
ncbi:AraC family transcriptional regulator [Arcicella aquatica]|uniref:AraC family transcriptional regulator n=1 Tax=Arcicella aquatica TaxID=217141 RepID=A0ABU5QHX6_9BACT|nr:AraC family transcriptional regulator [Arcicella aquatica]MEA5256657.1 AraC family transcriptional regulator [Arcicella aquatica]